MKEISRIESFGPVSIITLVSVDINRPITYDEQDLVSSLCSQLQVLINKNNLLMNKEYMVGIAENKTKLLECFGDNLVYVKEVPNEYYSENIEPWYIVTTSVGPIKIGWRKRVINIDWSESDVKEVGKVLFKGEETTGTYDYEYSKYIHTWSYEKAKEYVQKLLNTHK